ncbi:hypothetical protein Kpol_520p33 [Vanderwaltozyma polyspora DSM 70294]|uniref:RBR-type E3 ubiquitin transferase n=1 Tax=Vanderwaltozyma polyspora (strain ATCC 22028 / DSM 70294 / BCRC 21397 / CBS 2163 / NBRC 10782 / NRRL Y-8283 / UCD 57-17) TaxID=436907 RepID=A7TMB6_VANPO|nr:uncharacterized protein Kpol_520p33 [Vanderwaltozyma polyspora DSM 70294]EDO16610.1 hypothetical protein Kpol_520p33 [Vanderwaltozyma polyspora DSM 70294]
MEDKANLRDDLTILTDMYPELDVSIDLLDSAKELTEIVTGCLPFKISLPTDVTVEYENKSLILDKLQTDLLRFSIDPKEYPSLNKGLKLEIFSQWMGDKFKNKIIQSINSEFGELTDPNSDRYDPFTPILMLVFSYVTDDVASLIFPDNKYICRSEEEFKLYENSTVIVKEEEITKSNYSCCICMDIKKGDRMIKLPCIGEEKHLLCVDCTKNYFTNMIEQGNINGIRCPECKYNEIDLTKLKDFNQIKSSLFTPMINFLFFEGILEPEMCERYKELHYNQAATKLSKHCTYACVTCRRCDQWCVKEDLDDSMVRCNKCEFVFCFDCLHSWHGYNNKCGKKVKISREVVEEYIDEDNETSDERKKELEAQYGKKMLEQEVSEYLSDKMLDLAIAEEGSDLQRCPNCRLVVQRSEGCNKMKCSVCNHMFCYLCGELLYVEDPYEHFREPWSPCYGRLFEGMQGVE